MSTAYTKVFHQCIADSWYSNAARSCKALIFFIFSQLSDNFYMALLKQLKFIEQCSKNSTYRV